MSFVSYAQNFEDVLLWRALQHVEGGKYLDIGAQDPVLDSVSLAFYEAGWRGINVEAAPAFAARLREARPDEIVIEAAVTDDAGPIDFFEIVNTGLSTGRAEIAEKHAKRGYGVRQITVATLTLDQLLTKSGHVHWMKIDVEGMEAEVLASWRNNDIRPWIVVIEATVPLEQIETDGLWSGELTSRGYRHVHFDGLSRYFVHQSQSDLMGYFSSPPNVFDGFQVTKRHFSTAEMAAAADEQEVIASKRRLQLETELEQVAARLEETEQEVALAAVRRTELETRLTSLTARVEAAEAERAASDRHAHRLSDDLSASRNKLESALHALSATQRDHREQLERMSGERDDREQWLLGAQQELQERIESKNDQLLELHRNEARLSSELYEAQEGLKNSYSRVDHLRERLTSAEALIAKAIAEPATRWQSIGRALGLAPGERVKALLGSYQAQVPPSPIQLLEPIMSAAPPQDASLYLQASSLAELLSLDGSQFVRSAYATMLGREADAEGERYYIHRLEQGFPKLQILRQMGQSSEAALFPDPLPGLSAAFKRYRLYSLLRGKRNAAEAVAAQIVASSGTPPVEQFMQYYDEEFVRVVYLFYLAREPDPAGLQHYSERLRMGISRQQILLDIVSSSESRRHGKRAFGERALATSLAVERLPVIGTAVTFVKFVGRIKGHLRDMRALQNHLYRVSKKVA